MITRENIVGFCRYLQARSASCMKIGVASLYVLSSTIAARAQTDSLLKISRTLFELRDPGTEEIIDYEKYGVYQNVGTPNYNYVITNLEGLARASGEGIDPCLSLTNNPAFKAALKAGKLSKGNHWKHVNTSDPQLDFFVWSAAPEDPGVRLLFVGKALEKAGHLMHALKG